MKKYQFFISSTYEDLKEERNAVIYSILNASQFPVGMEMFSASDDDQWQVIVESIDSSDYFVLIVGNKYGSIDDETGISYTEKEFDYAVSKGIPILAFIVDKSVPMTSDRTEQEQEKIKMLKAFKDKVLSHRYVKHWKSIDDLKFLISQSIANEIIRAKRPGWIRATEFDIEKSHAEILRLTERVNILEDLNKRLKLDNGRMPDINISVIKDANDRFVDNIEMGYISM
jgi:hypothetical protein